MTSFTRRLTVAFAAVFLALLAAGFWFYHSQEQQLRGEVEATLQSVVKLKADEISQWRAERLADAAVLAESPFLADAAAHPTALAKERLLTRFHSLQQHYHYHDVLLLNNLGQVLLSLSGGTVTLDEGSRQALAVALRERRPVMSDLHVGPGQVPHLDVVAPLLGADVSPSGPSWAIILQSDAGQMLYPLLQSWPTPAQSAESLLVRRDGDAVLFLNDLRFQTDTALKLRLPLTRTDLPAVMAVQGREGVVEGIDYRGVPVLSVLKAVPDSPWYLVAKVDTEEALAVWRTRSALIVGLVLVLLLAACAAAGLVWQHSRKRHYLALLEAEKARLQSEERYRITLLSIGDGVIATDGAGRVDLLNPVAEALTGWRQEEARTRPVEEVFNIVNEKTRQTAENPVTRVLKEGVVVGLANHTALIARDGRECPIADSGSPIRDETGETTGVVLVFRDQTVERASQRALEVERNHLHAIMSASPVGLLVLDETEQIVDANPAAERMFGKKLADCQRLRCGDFLSCVRRHEDPRGCGNSPQCPSCQLYAAIRNVLAGGAGIHDQDMEAWIDSEQGRQKIWLTFSIEPVVLNGRRHAVMALDDITHRKQAEYSLEVSETKYRRLFEASRDGVLILDAESGRIVEVNPFLLELLGLPREQLLGQTLWEIGAFSDIVANRDSFLKLQAEGYVRYENLPLRAKDGQSIAVEFVSNVYAVDGHKVIQCNIRDITERKRAEEALAESRHFLESCLDALSANIAVIDKTGRIIAVNQRWRDFARANGAEEAKVCEGADYLAVCAAATSESAEGAQAFAEAIRAVISGRITNYAEEYACHSPNEQRWFSGSLTVFPGEGPRRVVISHENITDKYLAVEAVRENSARLDLALQSAQMGVWGLDLIENKRRFDDQACRLLGIDPKTFLGTPEEFYSVVHPDDREKLKAAMASTIHEDQFYEVDYRVVWPDGSSHDITTRGRLYRDPTDRPVRINGGIWDITRHKLAEEALRESETRFRSLIEAAPEAVFVQSDDRYVYINPAGCRLYGITKPEELVGTAFMERMAPEYREAIRERVRLQVEKNQPAPLMEQEHLRVDGSRVQVETTAVPIRFQGRAAHLVFIRDITARKELEQQLLQAQKMEAIGQLAGGVAHDFRNQLTVIKGYGERLLRRFLVKDEGREIMEEILRATERSTQLTGQLLAFSRKQTFHLQHVDLGDLIAEFSTSLSQMVGEDMTWSINSCATRCLVEIDPGQFQQALINLVSNAHDAMPKGGKLKIATTIVQELKAGFRQKHPEAQPGAYSVVEISDTGCGMDEATLAHLFEPFFTTKPVGQGTGLGLAMVYGFVKQSNGLIEVESRPGQGTTFRLYFPQSEPEGAAESEPEPTVEVSHSPGDILLVEDERLVRRILADSLQEVGYTVTEATNAAEALVLINRPENHFDLLVTDVVMPGGSGVDLAKSVHMARPDLPILFLSGYAGKELSKRGVELDPQHVLVKPVSHEDFVTRVHQLLAEARGRHS